MLIESSQFELQRILKALDSRSRRYDLLTGEFRAKEDRKYLGSEEEIWDPERVLDEAKFVHFSDWPLPKPWIPYAKAQEDEIQPECHSTKEGEDCRDREIWPSLYADFARRRKLCKV